MRTFIAIELPGHIKHALADLAGRLRRAGVRASWVNPDNIHLTLRFLGEIEEEQVERLAANLAPVYEVVQPFALHVLGTGAFPNTRRPSVLWTGCEPAGGPIMPVQEAAEQAARALGLPPEPKTFHPHLTLARVKEWRTAGPVADALESERHFDAGEFRVQSVALFLSRLSPAGASYQRLREFKFQ